MAASTNTIVLEWENDDKFSMTFTDGEGKEFKIIEMEENGCIAELWGHVANICKDFFAERLQAIGKAMKE